MLKKPIMEKNATPRSQPFPYPPSWIDRFDDWAASLSAPWWAFYLGSGIALIIFQVLFQWVEGGHSAGELVPVLIFNGLATPFLLGLIHFLDQQAETALGAMRPSLEMTEAEYQGFEYRLANMPFTPPLVAGLTMVIIVVLMERWTITPARYTALEQLPVFTVLFQIIDKASAFMFGVIFYHTIRQLRLVNHIHANHVHINLFNIRPLQAFSKLTASTALGLMVGIYGWMLINPELLSNPVSLGFVVISTVLALVVFVWPLLGIHRLMELEKDKQLQDIDRRFETVFSSFNQHFNADNYAQLERFNGIVTSLQAQYRRIRDIPTWPWKLETARFAFTAIALPLLLTVLQFLVLQAFSR